MANTLVQFHEDAVSKTKATYICKQLGIDLQTYLRMCISRLIQENGIPFSTKLDSSNESKAIQAMKMASIIAAQEGIADMTLDEINAEISAVREDNNASQRTHTLSPAISSTFLRRHTL